MDVSVSRACAQHHRCLHHSAHTKPAPVRIVCRATHTPDLPLTRRDLGVLSVASIALLNLNAGSAHAAGRSALRRKIPVEEYVVSDVNGLKTYDLISGKGAASVAVGTPVVVHWEVRYKGIDVLSSRAARTLGGNRTVAEPLEFVAGETIGYSIVAGGPKPPPALTSSVLGMKEGGVRSVIVDKPELGYNKRMQEIPAGEEFELRVEVLDIKA